MTTWEPIKTSDLNIGSIGYVEFTIYLRDKQEEDSTYKQRVMIICEVIGINKKLERVEITPVAGDRSCVWINSDDICTRHDT